MAFKILRATHMARVALVCMSLVAVVALATLTNPPTTRAASPSAQWPMFGQNYNNTASGSTNINTANIRVLKPKWTFTTSGDVSARAAVVNKVAYFPDWGGNIYAVNAIDGKLIWSKNILTDYFFGSVPDHPGVTKVVSRTSAFVDTASNTVYLGTQTGAHLLAIDTASGTLKWMTRLDPHPLAIDTTSPIVYNGVVYVGVASLEEAAAADPNYPCCSFRGSAVALNSATGQILWKTYMVPDGYTGGSIWGSTLVPDPTRNALYVTTGNNYSTPPAYQTCIANGGTAETCRSPNNHFDSVLSLSMTTGAINWATWLTSVDDWNVACFNSGVDAANCPEAAGPDFDFGSGVNLLTIQTANGPRTILGAGQKSGVYSAFDPSTGALLWATQVGPGSALGGIQWGSATDGKRIYVGIGNLYGIPYTLQPSGQVINAGSWSALDPLTGQILWQTADPNGALDLGPMTVANGIVYAPSMAGGATSPNMFALNAATGGILWSFASGGSVIAGASIAYDTVYWGSGYSNLGIPGFTGNNKLYAFTLAGQ
jgi:polyvinyl alcohol dehydrogenase (cytochrome)